MDANVAVLNCRLGNHTASGISPGGSTLLLKDVQHQEELAQLPEIRLQGQKAAISCAIRRNGMVPKSFSHQRKPDYVLHKNKDAGDGISGWGLIDIREESFESDCACSPKPTARDDGCENAEEDRQMTDRATTATGTAADSGARLLSSREKQGKFRFWGCRCGVSSSQTQLRKLHTPLSPEKPHRPFVKSHSHGDFSLGKKESGFPDVSTNGSKRGKPPKTRSSSVVTVLNKLPSIFTHCKSSSSRPEVPTSAPSSSSSSPSQPTTAYSPTQGRKQRVRQAWRRAGEKLGLRLQGEGNNGSSENCSWACGPGDVIRPNYSRWLERRHALADPERMCMTQEMRERLEKEIVARRRSLKRRVSKFITVNLGLNVEEDLAA